MSKNSQILPISASSSFDPTTPYNALPLLPPKADLETRAIMRKCVAASRALAELKLACELLPNPNVIINTIPLREARDSSAIENIVTTTDKLFRFASANEEAADPATKETLRYRLALWEGFQDLSSRPLSTNTAVKVCRTIKDVDLDIRKTPGTTLSNDDTGEVIYTPPEGEALLRDQLRNWETFLHADSDLDPLIRMAVGHYQFEAIHPFPDGNGRTGRILNILYLIDKQLIDLPVLYLSRYIMTNRDAYYRLLRNVTTEGDWEAWIIFMLEAVRETAKWTTAKIRGVKELIEQTAQFVSEAAPKIYSHELVELIFEQPYCRITHLIDAGLAQRRTASAYLKKLCEIGVLEEHKAGREKYFVHTRYLKLLMSEDNDIASYVL